MKLSHARVIVQEPQYIEACRVIAEAVEEETVDEIVDETENK